MSLNKIKTHKLKVIKNKKGNILKYLSLKNNYFIKFGECYFNEIKKNQWKGWNYHKKNQCLLSVPSGKVEFIFSLEPGKKTKKIIIGKNNHSIIILPPKIWFKFRSLEKLSLVVNTLNFPHKDNEGLKIPIKI